MNAVDLFLRLEVERCNPINDVAFLTPAFYKDLVEWMFVHYITHNGIKFAELPRLWQFEAIREYRAHYRSYSTCSPMNCVSLPSYHRNPDPDRTYYDLKMIPKYVFLVNPFITVQRAWLLILTRLYKEVHPEELKFFYCQVVSGDIVPDRKSAPLKTINAIAALWEHCNDTGYPFVPSVFIDLILDTNDDEKRMFDYLMSQCLKGSK